MAATHEAQDERLTQASRLAMADALAPLAQRARGCHAAALHLAGDGNDEGMAQAAAETSGISVCRERHLCNHSQCS